MYRNGKIVFTEEENLKTAYYLYVAHGRLRDALRAVHKDQNGEKMKIEPYRKCSVVGGIATVVVTNALHMRGSEVVDCVRAEGFSINYRFEAGVLGRENKHYFTINVTDSKSYLEDEFDYRQNTKSKKEIVCEDEEVHDDEEEFNPAQVKIYPKRSFTFKILRLLFFLVVIWTGVTLLSQPKGCLENSSNIIQCYSRTAEMAWKVTQNVATSILSSSLVREIFNFKTPVNLPSESDIVPETDERVEPPVHYDGETTGDIYTEYTEASSYDETEVNFSHFEGEEPLFTM